MRTSLPSPTWTRSRAQSLGCGSCLDGVILTCDSPSLPLGQKIGYQFAWLTFALINLVLLLPVVLLRFYGPGLRKLAWQAPPTFHNDL